MWETPRRIIGFFILLLATLTYIASTKDLTFAFAIGYVLLLFAWTDYFSFIIYTYPAFGAIAGFLIGNLKGLLYGVPTGLAFVLFAALTSANKERAATVVFLLSIPIALVNSYLYPVSSPINWAFIGLMVGIIENAIVEEMAEGDVFIISLYFMTLGPLAFIPTALQAFTGRAFFEKRFNNGTAYPVGPAMFVIAVPLFMLVPHLVNKNVLPEWLFYAHFHGVQNPELGFFAGLAATFLVPRLIEECSIGDPREDVSLAGGTMGAMAGLVTSLITFVLVTYLGTYLKDTGRETLALIVGIGGLFTTLLVGMVTLAMFSQLHYEGKSSIPYLAWFWSLNSIALTFSVPLLRIAWREFPTKYVPEIGLFTAVMFLMSLWDEREDFNPLTILLLEFFAFLAGIWVGFSLTGQLSAYWG